MSQIPGDGPPSARFLSRFGVIVFCALTLIVAVNYLVNPLDLYASHLLPPMVRSSRAAKLQLISEARRNRTPDAIVLGSSRAMQIAPATITRLTGRPAFNFAVDSARAEDYLATLRWLVEEAEITPHLLIIGADVEAFHNHVPPDERLLAIPALSQYLRHGERSAAAADRLRRLVSQQQTSMTASSLVRALAGRRDPVQSHFEADGYLRYDVWERERLDGRFDLGRRIADSVSEYVARFADFSALSAEREDYFREVLGYAKSKHIATIVYVTPLHPVVIRALLPLGYADRLAEATVFLSGQASQAGAAFFDFSTIERFGGDPRGFWDGGHIDPANADLISERLLRNLRAVQ